MKPSVEVTQLSKLYRIGGPTSVPYRTLRDSVAESGAQALKLFRRFASRSAKVEGQSRRNFWALRDVSFQVMPGEVLGVIGRNGAGKSTLLKILSRITEPTSGRALMRGRLGSLLEVGTGFHQELTGRENIFLSGAILGMRHREILRQFDSIVEFAEISQFLDTPVKRYSSGMYVRLAFAVAAHLQPEILIVDEVLAVGDLIFQKKCLNKMQDISGHGRTVLFVSHNMAAIEALCTRGLFLESGQLRFEGDIKTAVAHYTQNVKALAGADLADLPRSGNGAGKFVAIELLDKNGQATTSVRMGDPLRIKLSVRMNKKIANAVMGITFKTMGGLQLFRLVTKDQGVILPELDNEASVLCELPSIPLLPNTYFISMWLSDSKNDLLDAVEMATTFEVLPADVFGTGIVPQVRGDLIFAPSRWQSAD